MIFTHIGLDPIEMKTVEVDGKRYYLTPEGNNYPSITTVIGANPKKQEILRKWRARVGKEAAQKKSTKSAGRGTKVHKLFEDYLNNEDLDYKDPLSKYMFVRSKDTLHRINNIYLQEAALYSDTLELAGRVDCIAEFDGVLSIIDFKTSDKVKKEEYLYDYYVQECAYALCLEERYGIRVKQLVTIVAVEDGPPQVSIQPVRKEYLVSLLEYIQHYRSKYGKKSGG